MLSTHITLITLATVVVLAMVSACRPGCAEAGEFVLVREGQPAATIVTAVAATDAAAFAAEELQYHVQKITGATLPIKLDTEKVEGPKILVGFSTATAQLGLEQGQFKDQEYLIRFVDDDTLVLLGKDAPTRTNVEKAKNWPATAGMRLPPPPMFDHQATSYAVHDFLERFCNIRWYGPGELQMVVPKSATLAIQPYEVRRSPVFAWRGLSSHMYDTYGLTMASNLYDNPSPQDMNLFWARLRLGGEAYQCNHSLYAYYDRFWEKNPKRPEMFVAAHPDWFAQGYDGQPPQMCYSSQNFIDQVATDARKFFDGEGTVSGTPAAGKYYALVPMDRGGRGGWCKCPACQSQIDQERLTENYFDSNGSASDYWFEFVNKVAREVAKTHPHKYISTLAYAGFSYYPRKVRLEPNISVQMCLHTRNWWAAGIRENELQFYRDWIRHEKGRPLFLWLYHCMPELNIACHPYRCFPGFHAHELDRQIKMFARDGIRGAFIEGVSDQIDAYVTMKLLDDPSLDVDVLLDEFFKRYYGPAVAPMKKFYLLVEETFSNPANYPKEVQEDHKKDFLQNEEIAWKYLGTEPRMVELSKLMDEASQLAVGEVEKQRVALFRKAIWDHMVEGRRQYLEKNPDKK